MGRWARLRRAAGNCLRQVTWKQFLVGKRRQPGGRQLKAESLNRNGRRQKAEEDSLPPGRNPSKPSDWAVTDPQGLAARAEPRQGEKRPPTQLLSPAPRSLRVLEVSMEFGGRVRRGVREEISGSPPSCTY